MQDFFVRFYRPLPTPVPYDLETLRTDGISLDPRRTSLTWATQLPGGYGSMSAGYAEEFVVGAATRRVAWLERSVECPPQGHIVIATASGGQVYAGRRAMPTYQGAGLTALKAAGYGTVAIDDGAMTALPAVSTTGLGVLRYVLGTLNPPIQPGSVSQFQDPGVPYTLDQFQDQTPKQVVDHLTTVGGGANVPFDFTMYEGRVANFLPRLTPAQPDYLIPFDPTVTITHDDTQLYESVKVTYTTPPAADGTAGVASSVSAFNPTFYATYGFHRGPLVVPGGVMTPVIAAQFAATWLALHAVPWVSATVTRPADRGVELYAGMAERPAFYVRAGEWCQIGTEPPLSIISTQFAAHTDAFTMTLGQPEGGFISALQGVIDVATAVRRGTNVSTGSGIAA